MMHDISKKLVDGTDLISLFISGFDIIAKSKVISVSYTNHIVTLVNALENIYIIAVYSMSFV